MLFRDLGYTGREGIGLRRVAGGARLEDMGGVGLNIGVQRIARSWDIWSGRDGAEGLSSHM